MSQRRNWDRVRRENKVETNGALSAAATQWDPMKGAIIPKPGPASEDLKVRALKLLSSVIFEVETIHLRYCRLNTTLEEFVEMNQIGPKDDVVYSMFADVKRRLKTGLEHFAEFVARSDPNGVTGGFIDIELEYKKYTRNYGLRPNFSIPIILPPFVH